MKTITSVKRLALAVGLLTSSGFLSAADLAAGDVINAANLDQRLDETFHGDAISTLLTDRQKKLVLEEGLVITLKDPEDIPMGEDYLAATEQYSGTVTFNPDTRMMEGWKAGIPFPDIDLETPNAAEKLIWNHHVAQPSKNYQEYPDFTYLFVDDDRGLERTQQWVLKRLYLKGRLGEETTEVGDENILFKQLLYATYPADIRGLGLFTIRYDSPKLDDSWAYIKSVRRTRRLSGGTWMDPIGGTDQLNDDIEIFNAHPTWYPEYKLLGKKKVLVIANRKDKGWVREESGNGQYPAVDLDNAPYWNPVGEWEPREVWVIEATAPPEHPYSKKVLYMDTQFPRFYMADVYDRKGEFWKWMFYQLGPYPTYDNDTAILSHAGFTIDYQRRHATIFLVSPETSFNTPVKPNEISLRQLEQAAAR
ncbi:DUF1329 domain-containing protein [Marinobacter sp. AL4B]|uniref:DUF1329 domain-containing protein n=1 Tax=Marinobacter sp. AL4B TaxID=2871173 RepID=UPI001CAA59D5|nr:DUF1329 domain-containing protein [Marinobacter sp. AL4B]MBZ0333005.1 DUF1329 domain-containing protein [Marinobacter sp. AL4B]